MHLSTRALFSPQFILLLLMAIGLGGCSESPSGSGGADADAQSKRPRYAMIPKGTTHTFWNAVHRGAKIAADDLDVELIWKGPLKENDRAQQIQVVQQFALQKVDGIALAPLDHTALTNPVKTAKDNNIPVVVFDSGLTGEPGVDFVSFVATNNREAGRMAGQRALDLLPTDGKVVILRYVVGSASTHNREEGFLEAVRERGDVKVLVDNRYAGATAGDAKTQALNLLDSLRQADVVFCSNESATHGMLMALTQEGLTDQVKFIGFDASEPLVAGLADGRLDSLVLQDPVRMGELSIRTLHAACQGETVDAVIDTGVALATGENMHDPEIASLLK